MAYANLQLGSEVVREPPHVVVPQRPGAEAFATAAPASLGVQASATQALHDPYATDNAQLIRRVHRGVRAPCPGSEHRGPGPAPSTSAADEPDAAPA